MGRSEEMPIYEFECKSCGNDRFHVVDGKGLPVRITLECDKCESVEKFKSDKATTWIKYLD